MAKCRQLCLLSSLFLMCAEHAMAQMKSQKHQEVMRHEIRSEGSIRQHSAQAANLLHKVDKTDVPTTPLTLGLTLKIKNKASGGHMAACSECTGVVDTAFSTLDNSCLGLTGANQGCGFTVGGDKAGEFNIIKVGCQHCPADVSQHPGISGCEDCAEIRHMDLVVIKSRPNSATGADFHSYLGVCGQPAHPNATSCGDSATFVRFYEGQEETSPILGPPMMFTISKESQLQETILLGEYVRFIKAGVDTTGRGAALSSCGSTATTGDLCAAQTNLYLSEVGSLSSREESNNAFWELSPAEEESDGTSLREGATSHASRADNFLNR